MEERVGSFVIDKKTGEMKPNPDDEAMAERHGLKKTGAKNSENRPAQKEVKTDA